MNQQWYQSAVDLMLSRSVWDVYVLAEKFTQILDQNDPIQPSFQTWFTTLFIAGDRGNIPGNNALKTQHMVESLLDPDFITDILENYPEGTVFPSREKLRNAILQSDYLEYFPEIKASLASSENSEMPLHARRSEIVRPYLSRSKFVSRLNLVFDLVSEHGEASLNWSKPEWLSLCYKARPDLFEDSRRHKISEHGFKKFWDEAKPLIKQFYTQNLPNYNHPG